MKHPDFYNVIVASSAGDYGLTHEEDNEVFVCIGEEGVDFCDGDEFIKVSISDIVEMVKKSKNPKYIHLAEPD